MSLAGVKYGKYARLVPDVLTHEFYENIVAFCLRMRENRSVRLQMADFKGFVSFVMVFMKNMV